LVLSVLHVALVSLTVVVTAKHFILDVVSAWLVVAPAFGIARLLPVAMCWPWQREAEQAGMQGRALLPRL
jgi:hypothetical protein